MSITANSLISDSFNFFKNQISSILLLSLISTIVSLILYYFLVPIDDLLTIIKIINERDHSYSSILTLVSQMSKDEKTILMKISLLSLAAIFIGLILLIASVLTYLSEMSYGDNISALQAFSLSLPILPRMLITIAICTLMIYFGFILFILPGILLTIGFSLSPVILITAKNIMPLRAISQSWNISFRYWWLILPIILLWVTLQILTTMLIGKISFLSGFITNIISFTINNLLTSFLLIYFFRLYMLSDKNNN